MCMYFHTIYDINIDNDYAFRNGSSNSPSTSLGALVSELGAGVKFDASQLSQAAKDWLDARVTEQVIFFLCLVRVLFRDFCFYYH